MHLTEPMDEALLVSRFIENPMSYTFSRPKCVQKILHKILRIWILCRIFFCAFGSETVLFYAVKYPFGTLVLFNTLNVSFTYGNYP